MIKKSSFKPAWWLPGPHLQTLWPALLRRTDSLDVHLKRERIELPDGDFLDLDWGERNEGPIIIMLHGLGGSVDSPYAKGMLHVLQQSGWRSVIMHFRGCSGEMNRLPRSYHSGDTEDLAYIINEIRKREKDTPLFVIGYSMGGNVLLKWLGETGQANPLQSAVAVSVPFDLLKAALHINRGIHRLYQWWLLRPLLKETYKKFQHLDGPIDINKLQTYRTFWKFDDYVTAPLHGFRNAYDYYRKASSRQYLKNIQIPTLIIQAEDDPVLSKEVIPQEHELSKHIELEISPTGGHVGFISGTTPGFGEYWLEERIPQYIQHVLMQQ